MRKLYMGSGSIRWAQAALAIAAVFLIAPADGFSQQSATKSSLDWVDSWTCVLANTEAKIRFLDPDGDDQPILIQWILLASDRTLSRGSQRTSIELVGNQNIHALPLLMPPLKPTLTMAIELRIRLANKPNSPWLAKNLTVYCEHVAEAKLGLGKESKLSLYDPAGTTAAILDNSDFAYQRVASLAALDQLDSGTLVVGEGISFDQQRGLATSLQKAAKRGMFVFCLAPLDGQLSIMEDGDARLLNVSIAQENILLRFDKRFDTKHWVTGKPTINRYELVSSQTETTLSINSNSSGWCWFEADFATSRSDKRRGRLVVCGFQLISHWERCPIPRHLFAKALNYHPDTQN